MSDEIARLAAQIERQDKFIALLMKKNKQLEEENARLAAENGLKRGDTAYLTTEDRQLRSDTTYVTTEHRQLEGDTAYVPADNGQKSLDIALFSQKPYQDALFYVLLKEMKRCNWASISHASALLMHFYSQPGNSHAHLRGFLHLTESGICKQIAMLKKRQLIVRTAFQQYTLTAKALVILQQAATGMVSVK